MSIAVLIACGPNDIEVPCMIFENLKQGKEKCDNLFKGYPSKVRDDGSVIYLVYLEDLGDNDNISDKVFIKHYYGCGGTGPFILTKVEFSQKFISWNLD